jgi:type IV pilus assembly protein PilC
VEVGRVPKITPRILENFTRLLSSLLAAGVPLSRALVILTKEAANPAARAKWKEVHDLVVDGMSLADAMAKSPHTFPRVYVAMVEAGETGGFLDLVLAQIADFQAREKEMKGEGDDRVALSRPSCSSWRWPCWCCCWCSSFRSFRPSSPGSAAKLPLLTQMIVGTSNALRHYGSSFLASGSALSSADSQLVGVARATGLGRAILRMPVIGPLVPQFAMSRFCRMLGTLLGAGVPLINGLNVARRSHRQSDPRGRRLQLHRAREGRQGRSGPASPNAGRSFAGSVLEMIAVAEESGKLDQELVRIANVTEGDSTDSSRPRWPWPSR